jgi:hypothetical protein
MTIAFLPYLAAAMLVASPALAACDGPDVGEAATVVTIPANESVDVFHYRSSSLLSVVEFCVREPGGEWSLVASHGTEQGEWSLLQPWIYPKTMQIKTAAFGNADLHPLQSRSRRKTKFGYLFSWFDEDPNSETDVIVYCYKTGTGCPASRRSDFQ